MSRQASTARLMPWAWVYLRLMEQLPGGPKCRLAVVAFVDAFGLEHLE